MHDIRDTVTRWLSAKRPVALATVVSTWGSSPRTVGSKMAVNDTQAMIGSVSGGCVENAVIEVAVKALADDSTHLLHFGVSDDNAWEVGLTCGGEIDVFVAPLDTAWWRAVSRQIDADGRAVTLTLLDGDGAGAKFVRADEHVLYDDGKMPEALKAALLAKPLASLQHGRTEVSGRQLMVDWHRPQPRLIIVGGVHVAIPLYRMAVELGFDVALVDPRRVYASDERFDGLENVFHSYPARVMDDIGLTPDTYVAVLTHDPKIDDEALLTALPSKAAYVGVMSSRKSHEKRIARLKEQGATDALIERIRTPIGIDIGATNPEEIALCILAEIVALRNGVAVPA